MYTVYNEDNNTFEKVEEPDPLLSYSYADYLQWKFEERLELIKGKIFKMSPSPAPKHQKVCGNLLIEIGTFLKKKTCQVFTAPFDVRLPVKKQKKDIEIDTVVQPDICIICDQDKIDAKGCVGAPDIIVEVLSPGNSRKEIRVKFELYEEACVKEYWIVNPAEENLIVYILNNEGKYTGGKMYAGGDLLTTNILPGLKIDVTEIFQ
ncbi:MAG TPA: Uma2 family endonuclease [Chitinophagaceae bacterium]|nr:Uma2 family endonuclease [Chitinophagaceae bacterium]